MVTDVRQFIRPDPDNLEFFKKSLWETEEAQRYLKIERGLAEETIKHFELGYDPDKNAIAIPIFKNKELINIRYRFLIPDKTKYIQEKDCEIWLYNENGIDVGLKKTAVLVVEGEFDCMAVWQSGIKNVVSPASGKDSYGMWLELLDPIAEVVIAYDNDKAGKDASNKFAERIGIEKCKEVTYPEGIKDATDFFKRFNKDNFKELIANARPFYTRKYNDLFDVINLMRDDQQEKLEIDILPDVKLTPDHLLSMTGHTNAGKTMMALNIAKRLVEKGVPTLVLPFERGIQTVGARFLQILFDKKEDELKKLSTEEWDKYIRKVANTPLYFSVPSKDDLVEVLKKAKRILGVRAVIVDHLDYMVRNSGEREDVEIRNRLHELKTLAIEEQIMMVIVTHPRRTKTAGGASNKPTLEDIRGSSAVAQDSETVIILDKMSDTEIEVDVQKNKGKMSKKVFNVDYETGLIGGQSDRVTLDDI